MKTSKRVCAALVAVVMIGGVLAPLTATAQQTQTPPPEPAARGPYQPTEGDRIGANFLNVIYVPGKGIVCGAGAVAGTLIMLLTFGSAYHAAVEIFNEGCGGKWKLTPYDVAAKRTPEEPY